MRITTGILASIFVSTMPACAQDSGERDLQSKTVSQIQKSHLEANIPPPSEFDRILTEDLLSFLGYEDPQDAADLQFELLRQGPTQSGVAYPKYYLWIVATSQDGPLIRGAARVAAVERVRFEVTDFMTAEEIRENPESVALVFPSPLVPEIVEQARGSQR